MKRVGSAIWQGGLKDGKGTVSSESGAIASIPYSFAKRFENEKGTNPEELIGAAHAACFSMALSGQLEKAGIKPASIDTRATVSMEKKDPGWTVTSIHLETTIKAPGGDAKRIEEAAKNAKEGCPISRLLAPGVPISLTTRVG